MPLLSLALIEPEIAGNVGAMLRTATCLGIAVHIVEPCGFTFSDKALRRASMDYADALKLTRHADRAAFLADSRANAQRLILLTTSGETSLYDIAFAPDDMLVMGSEGAGAPADMHAAAAIRARIPLRPGFRSLNVSVAAGIALGEANRQLSLQGPTE